MCNGEKKENKIISEDLNGQQLEGCDLYKCCKEIKLKKMNISKQNLNRDIFILMKSKGEEEYIMKER